MKIQKYCVLFQGKRSRAVPLPYAEGIQARFKKKYKAGRGDFLIWKYEIVKRMKIYDALDLLS